MEFNISKTVEEMAMQARENQEEFIFETIRPYCEDILQLKINKEELKQILLNSMQKQQPCKDCISRQAVIDAIAKIHPIDTEYDCTLYDKLDVMYVLKDLPSVMPQPKATGHWIDIMVGDMQAQACDQCKTFYPLAYTGGGHRFCPNCGAKMEEVEK